MYSTRLTAEASGFAARRGDQVRLDRGTGRDLLVIAWTPPGQYMAVEPRAESCASAWNT